MVRFGEGGERGRAAYDQASSPLRPVTRPGDPAPVYPIDQVPSRLANASRTPKPRNRGRGRQLRSVWNWEREVPELGASARTPPRSLGKAAPPPRGEISRGSQGAIDALGQYRDPRRVATRRDRSGYGDRAAQGGEAISLERGRQLAREVWRRPGEHEIHDEFWGAGQLDDRSHPRGRSAHGDGRGRHRAADMPAEIGEWGGRDPNGNDRRGLTGGRAGRAGVAGHSGELAARRQIEEPRRSWHEAIEAGLAERGIDAFGAGLAEVDDGAIAGQSGEFREVGEPGGLDAPARDRGIGNVHRHADEPYANDVRGDSRDTDDSYADGRHAPDLLESDLYYDQDEDPDDLDDDPDDLDDDPDDDPDGGPDGPNGGSRQSAGASVSSLDDRRSMRRLDSGRSNDRRAVASERSRTLMRRRRATIAIGSLPLLCLLAWLSTGSGLFLVLFVTAVLAVAAYLTLLAAVAADERVRRMADAETPGMGVRAASLGSSTGEDFDDWRADLGGSPRARADRADWSQTRSVTGDRAVVETQADQDWNDELGWEPAPLSAASDSDPTAPLADPFGQDLLRADRRPQPWEAPVTDMAARRLRHDSRADSDVGMHSVRPMRTRPAHSAPRRRRYGG